MHMGWSTDHIEVNSLHGQAIDRFGDGLVGGPPRAPDSTIEAVAMPSAPGWLLGVQGHPEWAFATNSASVAIFSAFSDACRRFNVSGKKGGMTKLVSRGRRGIG
jgi:putative glutamine amidotransferase